MDNAVERAIGCIWERYSEPLSLAEIAESALLSRFYFARVFRDTTGVTPGRFLAAVRIYQAKKLLLSTSLSVTDISFAVGYNSLGSFTNHFTGSVGVSPGRFRRMSRNGGFSFPRQQRNPRTAHGAVAGAVSLPDGYGNAQVYIGAFSTPIVQNPPGAAIVIDIPAGRPSCYHLPDVPEGTWFVHAIAVASSITPEPFAHQTALVGGHDPVAVNADTVTSAAVRLRHTRSTDPPVLLAIPDLKPRPGDLAAVASCAAVTPRPARPGARVLPRRQRESSAPAGSSVGAGRY